MNTAYLEHFSSGVLGYLADAAWRSAAVGLIAAAALRIFRARNVAPRLAVWSGVLAVALAMPGLMAMVPGMRVEAPVLRAAANFWSGGQAAVTVVPDATRRVAEPTASAKMARVEAQMMRSGGAEDVVGNFVAAGKQHGIVQGVEKKPAETIFGTAVRVVKGLSWKAALGGVYFAVLAFFLIRLTAGIVLGRRLVRQSSLLRAPELRSAFAEHARMSWISAAPRIAESELIAVPLTLGISRPMILLPVNWREWERGKLSAVLAHEFSHCARHDALTQRLSLLHRAIFWFSPLSWFLERRLAELGEEASDQAALAGGTDRAGYARILLEFFSTLHGEPGRVWWQGVSMAKSGSAEKRVDRILAGKGEVAMTMKKGLMIGFVAAALPIVFVAAAARPTLHAQEPPAAPTTVTPAPPDVRNPLTRVPPMPAAPRAGVAAPAIGVPTIDGVPAPAPMPLAPMPSAPQAGVSAPAQLTLPALAPVPTAPRVGVSTPAPVALASPAGMPPMLRAGAGSPAARALPATLGRPAVPPIPQQGATVSSKAVIRVQSGKNNSTVNWTFGGCTLSGTSAGVVAAAADGVCIMTSFSGDDLPSLSASITEQEIAFVLNGRSYSIRDQGIVDRARALYEPIFVFKTIRLGEDQAALRDKQRTLVEQMKEFRVKTPDMTRQLEAVQAELNALRSKSNTGAELSALQEQLGDLQRRIGNLRELMNSQIDNLASDTVNQVASDTLRTEFAEQEDKFAAEQEKFGKWQGDASRKATFELEAILEDAIARGVAVLR